MTDCALPAHQTCPTGVPSFRRGIGGSPMDSWPVFDAVRPGAGPSVDKRDGWTIQRSPARSLLHAADAARLQSAHPSWTNATPQPPRFHPVIMPRDAVEFAFRARDLGYDVVSPAVDRGSESDPVAAVNDLEANEKKPW